MNESKYSNELPILVMNHDSIGTNDNGINNQGDENIIDGQDDVDGIHVKRSMSLSAAEVKEQAAVKLHYELKKAQEELKLRDAEVAKLNGIREKVEAELEDLTASLFEVSKGSIPTLKSHVLNPEKFCLSSVLELMFIFQLN